MAQKKNSVKRSLNILIVLLILLLLIGGSGALFNGSFAPKFALDLAGGTELILTPVTENGEEITDSDLEQAIEIIRQRVDASGVAEAEITKQGTSNIVVGIPGETPDDETIALISQASQMRFRPVILSWGPTDESDTIINQKNLMEYIQLMNDSTSEDAASLLIDDYIYGGTDTSALSWSLSSSSNSSGSSSTSTNSSSDKTTSVSPSPSPNASTDNTNSSSTDTVSDETLSLRALPLLTQDIIDADPVKGTPSGYDQLTQLFEDEYKALDCTKTENQIGGGGDDPDKPLVACGRDSVVKYFMGPVAVEGTAITSAQSGLKQTSGGGYTNEWVVSLQLEDEAMQQFIDTADQIKELGFPRNTFAIALDGLVISAPSIQPTVTFQIGSGIEISGGSTGFTQADANQLANQLSFGALPINFEISSREQVSATLGSEQLTNGLIAGLIGLLLVVIYSLIQYNALGLVTIGSLVVAAFLTYGSILMLSWIQGYRLSLPGVIGIIVAIGVTADSFIVYFERIRDEIRDGRPLQTAVTHAWNRAIRTIIASDAVNFLCAVVLYMLAVGGVRGFAFTLGLTTIIDLVVIVLFTHPIVVLLANKPFFFLGHPLSGLNPEKLEAPGAKKYSVAKHDWLENHLPLLQKQQELDEAAKEREAELEEKLSKKSGSSKSSKSDDDFSDFEDYEDEEDDWAKKRAEKKAEKERLKAEKKKAKEKGKDKKSEKETKSKTAKDDKKNKQKKSKDDFDEDLWDE